MLKSMLKNTLQSNFLLPNRRSALLATAGWLTAAGLPVQAQQGVWPKPLAVPGGIARLPLGPAEQRPVATLGGLHNEAGSIPVLVLGNTAGWTALVGIALSARPGPASIVRTSADGQRQPVPYTIAAKQYAQQRLSVAPGTVDLSPDNQARYERERAHLEGVYATFTQPPALWDQSIANRYAHARTLSRPPFWLVWPAPRVQRPVAQPPQRYGHSCTYRHTGAGTASGPGD
jgi:Peptidase family M23 N-terminal domain